VSRGLVGRATLVAVALVALAWLGLGLRASVLDARGLATVEEAGDPPDTEALRSARASFQRAARRNADPAPELNEAQVLIRLDRGREAARLIESVVRDNPGNIRAWGLLATATASFDVRRSTQANAELLRLYGRVRGEPLPRGAIRSRSGKLYTVVPGRVSGVIDRSEITGGRVLFGGWAKGAQGRGPAEVLVVSNGRVVATVVASRPRRDIARKYGPRLLRSGFRVAVPLSRLADVGGRRRVVLFGGSGGEASPIWPDCSNEPQDVGC
jgi:hypothetical protein